MSNINSSNNPSALRQLAPCATVFTSSACIMVLELLAGRLISRYVGQSLYTWTAIIGVILAGIACGNYIGGRIADRTHGRGILALQFLVASLGCLIIFPLNMFAGVIFALAISWPLRILFHVIVTFLLPSILLGTISPVISKRALNTGCAPGRVVGNIYASSIAGSILGTFFTGFYLLMIAGTTYAAGGAAIILGAVGIIYAAGALFGKAVAPVPATDDEKAAKPLSSSILGLIAAVFFANLCLMAIEVVAGRILSRYYGQSLYTWTTIIGVVMAGMTIGSYLGGMAAHRFNTRKMAGLLFIAASIYAIIIPFCARYVNGWILEPKIMLARWTWSFSLSLPIQITACAIALFLIPSILIAAASPMLLRTALENRTDTGRTVGAFFAWGSLGSIAGTFLAGFFLIASAGTVMTLFAVAVGLGLLGVVVSRTRPLAYAWAGCGCLVLLGIVVPGTPKDFLSSGLAWANFSDTTTVYSAESQYSYINILAEQENPRIRQMVLDRLIHSKIDLDNPEELKYEYEWVYTAVMDQQYAPEKPITALIIGGGGYTYPRYLELTRPSSHVEVAEIDPAVTRAAMAAFGLPEDTKIAIHHMDARNRIADLVRAKNQGLSVPEYDLIFGDSVNDYSVPYHLTTKQFNDQIYDLLKSDGMYLLNIIDSYHPGKFLAAVVNTCRQTFPHVYAINRYQNRDSRDTFIIINSKKPLDLRDIPAAIAAKYPYEGELISDQDLNLLIAGNDNLILTDDFAPVENLLAPVVLKR